MKVYKILAQPALITEIEYGQGTRTLKIFTPLFNMGTDLCGYLDTHTYQYSVNNEEMARDHGIGYYFRVVFNAKKVESLEMLSDLIYKCESLVDQYRQVIELLMAITKIVAKYKIETHSYRDDFCVGNMTRVPPDAEYIFFRSPISFVCKLYDGSSRRFIQTVRLDLLSINATEIARALFLINEDMRRASSYVNPSGVYEWDPVEVDSRSIDVINAKKEIEGLFLNGQSVS